MVEDWLAVISNMNGAVRDLRQAAPEVMKTFGDVARAAHVGNALDDKTKELLARAISVAIRCDPCIAYHAEGAIKQGPLGRPWPKPWPWPSTWTPAPR